MKNLYGIIIFLFSVTSVSFGFFILSNSLKNRKKIAPAAAHNSTKYYLYTRKNERNGQIINISNINESYLIPSNPTRIIIHGWRGSNNASDLLAIKDAYLKHGHFNVIIVDWSFASSATYIFLSSYIGYVGQTLGKFLKEIIQVAGISLDNIYLIGFSMGAHIAGYSSKMLHPDRVNTIYALDAAGPIFEEFNLQNKLSLNDAKYVESIHTNIEGDIISLGHSKPIGQASFYPAYGAVQPGCMLPFCSHRRVVEYFAESINSPIGFVGKECRNYEEIRNKTCTSVTTALMGGEPSRPNRTGVYYVEVKNKSPFAVGYTGSLLGQY